MNLNRAHSFQLIGGRYDLFGPWFYLAISIFYRPLQTVLLIHILTCLNPMENNLYLLVYH